MTTVIFAVSQLMELISELIKPYPFSPKWYSHKLNVPGLCYKVGIAIQTGYIVWVHEPFPCGKWPNNQILQDAIIYHLDDNKYYWQMEDILTGNFTITPTGLNEHRDLIWSQECARHENCNGYFKHRRVIENCFRHKPSKHNLCFCAIAIITQILFWKLWANILIIFCRPVKFNFILQQYFCMCNLQEIFS